MTISADTHKSLSEVGLEQVETEFAVAAPAVLSRLSAAMRALIDSIPGGASTAAELERSLGVTKKVAWQVHRIAEAREALAAATFVPGADPLRKLLAAAQKRRIPASVRSEIAEAFSEFERLVEQHAGDRANFLSMIGATDSKAGADVDRLHRRACFRAYSHFYGAQIQTRYGVMMVRKDPADRSLDTFVSLRARLGLRRLRSDSTVVVDRYFVTTGREHEDSKIPTPRPLDPVSFAEHGAPILPAFSTRPLPRLQTIEEGSGVSRIELAERAVGVSSAVDLVFGTVTQGVAGPVKDDKPHGFHTMAKTDLPAALMVLDVFVHAGDYGRLQPELYVYADPGADDSHERRERSPLLKIRERVEYVGRGLTGTACADLPRYTETVAHLCGGLGWHADEFDVYRLRIEYPLMHTIVRVAFPVPRPDDRA
jgi:hypothetical protein